MTMRHRLAALERQAQASYVDPDAPPPVSDELVDEVLEATRRRIREAHEQGTPERVEHLTAVMVEYGVAVAWR